MVQSQKCGITSAEASRYVLEGYEGILEMQKRTRP